MTISKTERIIEEFRKGKMVVLMDDEDRENEGDLIMPAVCCTPEAINFMAQYGRGLICLALSKKRCNQLNLELMVNRNRAPFSTAFTNSIEAASGVTTGISAADRATTVLAAVAENAKPDDIVQPGHVFPLMAQEGGVLVRTGHTEASTDLAKLAGMEPAAVICEVMKDDGTMARRDDLEKFCEKHNLLLGTVADLVEYRMQHETTVKEVSECKFPTAYGEFRLVAFQDTIDHITHFALIHGDLSSCPNPIVRVHLNDYFSDVLMSDRSRHQSFTISEAMEVISKDTGVLLIINTGTKNEDLLNKIKQFEKEDHGEADVRKAGASKRLGIGSQILKNLGITTMRLMSTQTKYNGLSGYNLKISEFIRPENQ
jgi:3,4-dihydroxy 2-butanone 4-phosphate synthase/GTP cyclohydrolase II